ncbi:ATP-binding protein [Trichlorobacter ammonificans]|nr:ATP-binding protein [Trichlorobacter ammonificans]
MNEYVATLQNRYERVQNLLKNLIESRADTMSTAITFISDQKRFQRAMLGSDWEALRHHAIVTLEKALIHQEVSHVYFYDRNFTKIVRVYQPEKRAAGPARFIKQQAMQSGEPFSGLELGSGGTFSLRTIHPWKVDGQLIGYIELGQEIGAVLQELKTISEIDYVVSYDKRHLERDLWEAGMKKVGRHADWGLLADKVIADQSLSLPSGMAAKLFTEPAVHKKTGLRLDVNGRIYSARSFPLYDVTQQHVGDFVTLKDSTEESRAFRTFLAEVGLFSLLVSGGLFCFAYRVLGNVDRQLSENRQQLNEEFAKQARTNRQLESEIAERKSAEERLLELNEHLEQRVQERTSELNSLNAALEGAYKDLQAQQATIVQQDKMACIGQLAASVAHDINNPIGFVTGNLEVLRNYWAKMISFLEVQEEAFVASAPESLRTAIEEKRRKLKISHLVKEFDAVVAESLEGTERVKRIVLNLKGFSRLGEPEARSIDIHDCLESTLGIVWNELRYKADIRKNYGLVPKLYCYPQQLNQVFMNLLINASQAIEQWGEISITTWADDESLFVAIGDTGCGIAEEYRARVFEPFFTTKQVGVGTGLGLHIAHEIIQRHHGEIVVKNAVPAGTVFTIRLPLHGVELGVAHA